MTVVVDVAVTVVSPAVVITCSVVKTEEVTVVCCVMCASANVFVESTVAVIVIVWYARSTIITDTIPPFTVTVCTFVGARCRNLAPVMIVVSITKEVCVEPSTVCVAKAVFPAKI